MKRNTKQAKKEFIEIYKAKLCNIALSCRSLGIERKTFYRWYESDPDFKQAIEDAQEERKDFFENALILRCQAGDTAAIIFANKTQCRDRGYVEKVEKDVTVKTEQPLFGDYDESKEC